MLQLSGYLLDRPVLSLRTGGPVAWIAAPIINPHKLNIEGFYVVDSVDKRPLILVCQDVRELNQQGFIVDDHDVLVTPDDLVRLKPILDLNFDLIGKSIETTSREKIGKVSDYAVETSTLYVQKIYASRSIWKSLATGSLSIDRSQIVEVTSRQIIINDLLASAPIATPAIAS